MGFLKKDMNIKLAFMVAILLILFTSFAVYYEKNLKDISSEYKEKTEKLETITAKLVSEEAKAQEISQIKEQAQKDKEVLEKGYNELKNENEVLKEEINSVKSELEKTKAELSDKTNKFELLQARFNQVEESLIKANDDISRLAARISDLCEKLEDAGGNDDGC